jgi:hypothetical protein
MCTLTASELEDRGAAWAKLWATGLLHRDRIAGGIRLRADPGGEEALLQLIDLERECCAWIDFAVDGSTATLTAEGVGEQVLAGMFAPASSS